MIELYHNAMSTCSQKVRFTLAEKGLDFVSHHFNLRAGDQHRPDYLKLNPNGVVPTLVHDGKAVIESAVIDEYLDDVFPDPPLRPADAFERARMRIWVKQLDEGLHAASATISACIAFRYQFMEGKSETELKKTLDGYVDPAKRRRMTENVMKGIESGFFRPALFRVVKMLDDMQEDLSRAAWLAGEAFSLADIAFAPYVTRVDHLQQGWLIEERPKVAGWLARVRGRGAYRTGLADWFNPDFLSLMERTGTECREPIRAMLARR